MSRAEVRSVVERALQSRQDFEVEAVDSMSAWYRVRGYFTQGEINAIYEAIGESLPEHYQVDVDDRYTALSPRQPSNAAPKHTSAAAVMQCVGGDIRLQPGSGAEPRGFPFELQTRAEVHRLNGIMQFEPNDLYRMSDGSMGVIISNTWHGDKEGAYSLITVRPMTVREQYEMFYKSKPVTLRPKHLGQHVGPDEKRSLSLGTLWNGSGMSIDEIIEERRQ